MDVPNNRCTSQTATGHPPIGPHARSGPNQISPSNPDYQPPSVVLVLGPWSLEYTKYRPLENASLPFSILTFFQSRPLGVHNSHSPYAIASFISRFIATLHIGLHLTFQVIFLVLNLMLIWPALLLEGFGDRRGKEGERDEASECLIYCFVYREAALRLSGEFWHRKLTWNPDFVGVRALCCCRRAWNPYLFL